MDAGTIYSFVSNLLLGLHGNIFFLVTIWGGLIFLSWVWSGLEKAVRLFFFPGYMFYFLVKFFVLKKLGYEIRVYHLFTPYFSSVKTLVRLENLRHSMVLILSLSFSSILFYLGLNSLVELASSTVSKLIVAWLAISVFVNGLPRKPDFLNVFLTSLNVDVWVSLSYLNAFVILAIGAIIFDPTLDIGLFLTYLVTVGFITLTYPSEQSGGLFVTGDDLVLLEEN